MNKTYIIAEAGVNHNGSLKMAKKMIDVAAEAGVDAIKFQIFSAKALALPTAKKAEYQLDETNKEENQLTMLEKLEMTRESHMELLNHCKEASIDFLSTPFDKESLVFLTETLHTPVLKFSSGDLTNAPLLLAAAQSLKKLILSTGMATLTDIEDALGVLAFGYFENNRKPDRAAFRQAYYTHAHRLDAYVSLLHCTTQYPAPVHALNLSAMKTLQHAFSLPTGYSDHSTGITIPVAAVALGAAIIEKHFTLDHTLPGPDHKASLEPDQLKQMVQAIRDTEAGIGHPWKIPDEEERKNAISARKSLVTTLPIKRGEKFTEQNIAAKRPGNGIPPAYYWSLLGSTATKDYEADELITEAIEHG
ncbi:N-acetylneuraminate synthase [Thalassobacillus hwangdonensis]|uniref:N-acetylneuraminate synthase n=1 Tax=Thalassobacillus hwangdonensis TaxID=546108 RepID=A0ABW3L6B9_9BACI